MYAPGFSVVLGVIVLLLQTHVHVHFVINALYVSDYSQQCISKTCGLFISIIIIIIIIFSEYLCLQLLLKINKIRKIKENLQKVEVLSSSAWWMLCKILFLFYFIFVDCGNNGENTCTRGMSFLCKCRPLSDTDKWIQLNMRSSCLR